MLLAALTWPQAFVYATSIATAGLVVAILVWSIFRTGQTAIRSQGQHDEVVDQLARDVEVLKQALAQPS